jgi:hypothetical protein
MRFVLCACYFELRSFSGAAILKEQSTKLILPVLVV